MTGETEGDDLSSPSLLLLKDLLQKHYTCPKIITQNIYAYANTQNICPKIITQNIYAYMQTRKIYAFLKMKL